MKKISGVQVPILGENMAVNSPSIFIGSFENMVDQEIKPEEIVIKVQGDDIYIFGGNSRSTLYAVYTFIENYLGCRFLTPEVEYIPKKDRVSVPGNIDYQYVPPVTTRTVHSKLYYENHNFADKRKTTYEAFPRYVPKPECILSIVFCPQMNIIHLILNILPTKWETNTNPAMSYQIRMY